MMGMDGMEKRIDRVVSWTPLSTLKPSKKNLFENPR